MNLIRLASTAALALTLAAPLRAATPAPAAKPPTPATKPTTPTRPGAAAASPTVPAVAAILKEYQAAVKSGEALREKSDFLTDPKGALTPEQVAAIAPDMILAALERPIPGADVRADAYVKWQLLSGVKGKFPDELKARAIAVYRNAPRLAPHPGVDRPKLERLLNRVGISKADAEAGVNKEFGDVIVKYRLEIEPLLAYRDELYARLPAGFDSLAAGLGDIYARVAAGAPANEFWTTVSSGIRSWALTSSDPRQMRQLAGAVEKLRAFVKDEKNRPYYKVLWATEDKYTGLKWVAESSIQNDKSMEELGLWLEEHAKNPGGGLNFKEPETPKK